jgi:RNA polymerase sigma-70 factor (ECF subfamily)
VEPADQTVQGRMDAEKLRDAVAELPAEQAKLLRQAYFEELSHAEIAEQSDLPLGTVKSRLRLAKDKLRQALEGMR